MKEEARKRALDATQDPASKKPKVETEVAKIKAPKARVMIRAGSEGRERHVVIVSDEDTNKNVKKQTVLLETDNDDGKVSRKGSGIYAYDLGPKTTVALYEKGIFKDVVKLDRLLAERSDIASVYGYVPGTEKTRAFKPDQDVPRSFVPSTTMPQNKQLKKRSGRRATWSLRGIFTE